MLAFVVIWSQICLKYSESSISPTNQPSNDWSIFNIQSNISQIHVKYKYWFLITFICIWHQSVVTPLFLLTSHSRRFSFKISFTRNNRFCKFQVTFNWFQASLELFKRKRIFVKIFMIFPLFLVFLQVSV